MLLYVLLGSPMIAVALLLAMPRTPGWRPYIETIAGVATGVECLAGLAIVEQVIQRKQYNVTSCFSVNALGALVLATIVITGFIATLHLIGYLRAEMKKGMIGMKRLHQCYLLMQLFMLCMFVAVVATNPIIMWLSIEATTLSTVFLISFFNRSGDVEAAWKYLMINSIGLLLGLFGTILFISQVNHGGLTTWSMVMEAAKHMNPAIVKFAFGLVLIGYGTKMGLVPMHTWRPDAYNKTPLPVAALLSGPLLNVAFLAILRFRAVANVAVGPSYSQSLLIFFGVLSVVVPALIIYSQSNFKRLLGYSSTEQAGIMLLGIAFGGVGTLGALLQMMYHTIVKSLLFLLSSNISVHYSSSRIKNIKGLVRVMPSTVVLYVIGFLGLLGVPPFGLFFSELYVVLGGFRHYLILTLVIMALLIVLFVGIARHLISMLFGEPPEGIERAHFSLWMLAPVAVLTTLFVVISLYLPTGLQTLLNESVKILAGINI